MRAVGGQLPTSSMGLMVAFVEGMALTHIGSRPEAPTGVGPGREERLAEG